MITLRNVVSFLFVTSLGLTAACGSAPSSSDGPLEGESSASALGGSPVCDASVYSKVPITSWDQVYGLWRRDTIARSIETVEELRLDSDVERHFVLDETSGPAPCPPGLFCIQVPTRFESSRGLYSVKPGPDLTLSPDASSATDLPTSFGLQQNCRGATRLAAFENDVEVYFTRGCDADADCASVPLGPVNFMCMVGQHAAEVCNTKSHTCHAGCAATQAPGRCPAGQHWCPTCGILPPGDGDTPPVCTSGYCLGLAAMCRDVP
jgi:hypothetical protein